MRNPSSRKFWISSCARSALMCWKTSPLVGIARASYAELAWHNGLHETVSVRSVSKNLKRWRCHVRCGMCSICASSIAHTDVVMNSLTSIANAISAHAPDALSNKSVHSAKWTSLGCKMAWHGMSRMTVRARCFYVPTATSMSTKCTSTWNYCSRTKVTNAKKTWQGSLAFTKDSSN